MMMLRVGPYPDLQLSSDLSVREYKLLPECLKHVTIFGLKIHCISEVHDFDPISENYGKFLINHP